MDVLNFIVSMSSYAYVLNCVYTRLRSKSQNLALILRYYTFDK